MSYRLDRLSVLLIDDNRHMLSLLSEILRGLRIRDITMLTNAADAFKEMQITPVDVVFIDHAMSPISGIEFTNMIRTSKDSPDRFVPVIMVSGYSDTETVMEARDNGVTEFLAKPIAADGIYARILAVLERPRPFIRSKTFFGPDRRRRRIDYSGEERRKLNLEEGAQDGAEMIPAPAPSFH